MGDCLLHWTKNSSCFCPFDRISYDKVYIYTSYSQRFKKPSKILTVDKTGTKAADPKFIVSTGSLNIEEDEDQMNYAQFLENIVCKMCGASDRDDELLLCDGCDEAIHLDCCVPALTAVPDGEFFCQTCRRDEPEPGTSTAEVESEYVFCRVCKSQEDGDKMVICKHCDTAEHINCEGTMDRVDPDWTCENCWRHEVEIVRENVGTSRRRGYQTRSNSSVRPNSSTMRNNQDAIDSLIDQVIQRINNTHVNTTRRE